jgi:hypothetical protein
MQKIQFSFSARKALEPFISFSFSPSGCGRNFNKANANWKLMNLLIQLRSHELPLCIGTHHAIEFSIIKHSRFALHRRFESFMSSHGARSHCTKSQSICRRHVGRCFISHRSKDLRVSCINHSRDPFPSWGRGRGCKCLCFSMLDFPLTMNKWWHFSHVATSTSCTVNFVNWNLNNGSKFTGEKLFEEGNLH